MTGFARPEGPTGFLWLKTRVSAASSFSSLRLRHFGLHPIVENNEFASDGTAIVNLLLDYEFNPRWR